MPALDRKQFQSPLTVPRLAGGVVLLGVIVGAAVWAELQAENSFRTMVASQRIQLRGRIQLSLIEQAETAQRGYLLTEDAR